MMNLSQSILVFQYDEYEPFALAVIQKAVKDGLSVVAVDEQQSSHCLRHWRRYY